MKSKINFIQIIFLVVLSTFVNKSINAQDSTLTFQQILEQKLKEIPKLNEKVNISISEDESLVAIGESSFFIPKGKLFIYNLNTGKLLYEKEQPYCFNWLEFRKDNRQLIAIVNDKTSHNYIIYQAPNWEEIIKSDFKHYPMGTNKIDFVPNKNSIVIYSIKGVEFYNLDNKSITKVKTKPSMKVAFPELDIERKRLICYGFNFIDIDQHIGIIESFDISELDWD